MVRNRRSPLQKTVFEVLAEDIVENYPAVLKDHKDGLSDREIAKKYDFICDAVGIAIDILLAQEESEPEAVEAKRIVKWSDGEKVRFKQLLDAGNLTYGEMANVLNDEFHAGEDVRSRIGLKRYRQRVFPETIERVKSWSGKHKILGLTESEYLETAFYAPGNEKKGKRKFIWLAKLLNKMFHNGKSVRTPAAVEAEYHRLKKRG